MGIKMDREHMVRTFRDGTASCSRMITVLLLVFCIVLCPACSRSTYKGDPRKPYFPEEYQVKEHGSGKASAFGLNIAPAGEMGDWAVDWVSDMTEGEGFQYLLYADPDSWDAYLYYPQKQAKIRVLTNDDVAVAYLDGILCVYVTAVPWDSEEGAAGEGIAGEDMAESGVGAEDMTEDRIAERDLEGDRIAEEDLEGDGIAKGDIAGGCITEEDIAGDRITEGDMAGEDMAGDEGEKWLLHLAAPPVGAWPSQVELYWDGRQVPCDATEIKD